MTSQKCYRTEKKSFHKTALHNTHTKNKNVQGVFKKENIHTWNCFMQVLGKVLLCCQRHRSLMTSGTHMRTYCQTDRLYDNNYPQDSPHWAHLSLLVNKWMGGGAVYSILLPIVFSLPQRSQSSHLHGAPLHLPARRVINQGESLWQKRAPLALHICTRPRMNGGGGYYGRAGDIRLHDGGMGGVIRLC